MDEQTARTERAHGRRWTTALLLLLLAVGLLAAVAEAKKGHRGGAIVSCVSYGTGQVRIVRPEAPCGEGEYLMKWNIRGRAGADGARVAGRTRSAAGTRSARGAGRTRSTCRT